MGMKLTTVLLGHCVLMRPILWLDTFATGECKANKWCIRVDWKTSRCDTFPGCCWCRARPSTQLPLRVVAGSSESFKSPAQAARRAPAVNAGEKKQAHLKWLRGDPHCVSLSQYCCIDIWGQIHVSLSLPPSPVFPSSGISTAADSMSIVLTLLSASH